MKYLQRNIMDPEMMQIRSVEEDIRVFKIVEPIAVSACDLMKGRRSCYEMDVRNSCAGNHGSREHVGKVCLREKNNRVSNLSSAAAAAAARPPLPPRGFGGPRGRKETPLLPKNLCRVLSFVF